MIKTLFIKNYRSIEDLSVNLGNMNVFIGPNNAGKSNILKAINIILGETWPSNRSIDNNDYYKYDNSQNIVIGVIFNNPIQTLISSRPYDIPGLMLTVNQNESEFVAIDNNKHPICYSSSTNPIKITNEIRNQLALLYLGIERQANDQIKSSSWTLYGKIIKHLESQLSIENKERYKREISESFNNNIYPSLRETENILKNYTKEHTGLNLSLRLDVIDPIQALKNLRPIVKEMNQDCEYDVDEMGSGTQSSISISIGRAYSDLVRQSLVIAIEEPELYLHPHGKRAFYRKLYELSQNGIQILYTTHDPLFLDLSEYKNINIINKNNNNSSIFSGQTITLAEPDTLKKTTKFSNEANEAFFSKYTILVEGFSDKVACSLALERLDIDINKSDISIIDCNGAPNMPDIATVLNKFGIKIVALIDADPGNTLTSNIIEKLKEIILEDNVILQDPNLETIFGQTTKIRKEKAYSIVDDYFSHNEIQQIYRNLSRIVGQA